MGLARAAARAVLRVIGWRTDITVPDFPKAIICVAPHTSNWDFVLGKLAYASVGRHASFLMKSTWFFPPLGWLLRAIGGIPVVRRPDHFHGSAPSLVDQLVDRFDASTQLVVAVTPEGTRSRTTEWHTGFLRIAAGAHVPICLGAIDYATRTVIIRQTMDVSEPLDLGADLAQVKAYYRHLGAVGRHPDQFDAS